MWLLIGLGIWLTVLICFWAVVRSAAMADARMYREAREAREAVRSERWAA